MELLERDWPLTDLAGCLVEDERGPAHAAQPSGGRVRLTADRTGPELHRHESIGGSAVGYDAAR